VQGECLKLNDRIWLVYSGAGSENAAQAANFLVDQGVKSLISWGCAAALSDTLQPGHLLIPAEVSYQQNVYQAHPQWQQHALRLFSAQATVSSGLLVSSDRLVNRSADKRGIFQDCGAVGLDMESAAIMKIARQANIPGLVIRAVADSADMDLPQAVVLAFNHEGRIEIKKLVGHLLTHPWELPDLVRLGLCFNSAKQTLKMIAKQLDSMMDYEVLPESQPC
jgi:adenosylhomocysteine nucleosidase